MLVSKYSAILPQSSKLTLLQIGAHAGHEAGILEDAGYNTIAWVEADPDVFTQLQANLKQFRKSEHKSYNALITAATGRKHQFYRYSNKGASSSIFQPTELFSDAFKDVFLLDNTVELTSTSLDDFNRSHSLNPTTLIIDVQGAELEVLSGGQQTLSTVHVVEIEVSKQAIYEGGSLFTQVDSFLNKSGFKRVTAVPWHGDVLYINTKHFTFNDLLNIKLLHLKYRVLAALNLIGRFAAFFVKDPSGALQKLGSRMLTRQVRQ